MTLSAEVMESHQQLTRELVDAAVRINSALAQARAAGAVTELPDGVLASVCYADGVLVSMVNREGRLCVRAQFEHSSAAP